eukprot:GHVR01193374.1.p2 GENE.GHVR01193374.1~~GHVR01193374.1.p2  ORF type:complete len:130 (+),score=26.07 GHVR01193374.1:107-496(+)
MVHGRIGMAGVAAGEHLATAGAALVGGSVGRRRRAVGAVAPGVPHALAGLAGVAATLLTVTGDPQARRDAGHGAGCRTGAGGTGADSIARAFVRHGPQLFCTQRQRRQDDLPLSARRRRRQAGRHDHQS